MIQLIKYALTGVINTLVGYGVFWILFTQFNLKAEYANAIGYGIALIFAFGLNKVFVFNQSTFHHGMIPRFIVAFLAAFLINQVVLIGLHRFLGVRAEIAQIVAMATYTVLFYILNKRYVFNERATHGNP
ncbi:MULTISPECIES: GtrA family protein [unclassified Pseudomonas]|uniref:GtrA family protein n=1 Tax=unclassified Pseudomonas TaxID=196821 RepID=UPI001F597B6F|nr:MULTISPECIES: GtrA family protein [unclassified Pseudomonas]